MIKKTIGPVIFGLLFLAVPFLAQTAQAKCFGDSNACKDVFMSKRDGCQVVVNEGRDYIRVSNAKKNGDKAVGPVTKVYGASVEPIIDAWTGRCYTSGMYKNYLAEYIGEKNAQPEELLGIVSEEEILQDLTNADIEDRYSVFFKVTSFKRVYLRIRRPSGWISTPTFIKSDESWEYSIGPVRKIEYCWSPEKTPKDCSPYWVLRAGETKRF